ncbi:MAG: 16S rRNA (guanine(966)-N(2))-methyltransferase RsmD [Steroidobacter sp.]
MNAVNTHAHPPSGANRLRIIGGRWRGTRLNFPEVMAIRPTPDRVRETLFNWLQSDILNAHCLDLFAGSGALGLEALSRGASAVTFVDREAIIGRYLRETLARLHCDQGEVHTTDAMRFLQQPAKPFDIVFLDPPFADSADRQLLTQVCSQLETQDWLKTRAHIYIECPSSMGSPDSIPQWPANWTLHRSKTAGQVGYHLAKRIA